ncbi:hypothetical protein CA54_19420 [Symmachiella macrocystis]|uniref:Uncharacterized protein n=1 Tax=Symmachiella macrocystis TaxID=2527985 RepID=A0A5C6BPC0_9PLAN|nr:hypothetical protein CA54_19420 [Symmachiella macrocystis]
MSSCLKQIIQPMPCLSVPTEVASRSGEGNCVGGLVVIFLINQLQWSVGCDRIEVCLKLFGILRD